MRPCGRAFSERPGDYAAAMGVHFTAGRCFGAVTSRGTVTPLLCCVGSSTSRPHVPHPACSSLREQPCPDFYLLPSYPTSTSPVLPLKSTSRERAHYPTHAHFCSNAQGLYIPKTQRISSLNSPSNPANNLRKSISAATISKCTRITELFVVQPTSSISSMLLVCKSC